MKRVMWAYESGQITRDEMWFQMYQIQWGESNGQTYVRR